MEDLDPHRFLSALGAPPNATAVQVSGGWDTSLWRIESRQGTYALRVFRPEQLATWRREAVVMRMLGDVGVPVPTVQAEGVVDGRPALLLSWCAGRPLLQEVQARPLGIWRLALAMGRLHARIHAVPVPEAVAASLSAWTPRAEDADPELQALLRSSGDANISLLHLDYHPLNVMSHGRRITGVLDWANVMVGDRRADLARTATLLRLAPAPPGTPTLLLLALRGILEVGWRRGYLERQPTDPFADLEPFYIWAGAMMERDLRPKLGRPGVWLRDSDLARIHSWTLARRRRIGR